jgi:FAD/FMN-containing dehydrogenase
VTRSPITSWNRWPVLRHQTVLSLGDRHAPLPDLPRPFIAYGNGRSYSDVCLNDGGFLLDTRRLDKFISFDRANGRLACEAGVLLSEILDLVVPQGWFLPVTPGTRQVTVGGAIANDVHGKNHHRAGSFSRHVLQLGLRRSDGTLRICGPGQDRDWFSATVGGLGLTGVILWAEIQLTPISGPMMTTQARRFNNLDEFWSLNSEASAAWPYTVAWVDCISSTPGRLGRGVLFCGRHASESAADVTPSSRSWRIGVEPPFSLINKWSVSAFNGLYFRGHGTTRIDSSHYVPFFYPLDRVEDWNRLYGPRGFFQYQCVLPPQQAVSAVAVMLERIARSGEASFLAVLKTFGDAAPLGMLSFARPGVTLAVDFPNRGAATAQLFSSLDDIVMDAHGALYPAKDARMPAKVFQTGYPRASEFARFIDPKASSSFWRRVST